MSEPRSSSHPLLSVLAILVGCTPLWLVMLTEVPQAAESMRTREHLGLACEQARELMKEGRFDDARVDLQAAIAEHGEDSDALALLGTAWASTGNLELAELSLRRSVELDPDPPGTWVDLGTVLRALKREPEARQCFERALELDAEHPAALRALGR